MRSSDKTLVYITLGVLALALMLVFVWINASHGNTLWTVVFAVLASINAGLAGANFVAWIVERGEQ